MRDFTVHLSLNGGNMLALVASVALILLMIYGIPDKKHHIAFNTVVITLDGGLVMYVGNPPPGWNYYIRDYDDEEQTAVVWKDGTWQCPCCHTIQKDTREPKLYDM